LVWQLSAASVAELKVMSFNIWVQGGRSLTRCIDAIRNSDADVVGLQECNAATAQAIATSLGWHAFGAADTSIVSRYPIRASIPSGGGSGVSVELAPGQLVYIFNCHLPAYPYGPYTMREGQTHAFVIAQEEQTRMPPLNQLLKVMAPYLAGPAPCFLTGDFNAPSHLDYADFAWPTSKAPLAAGLRDAYRDAHPDLRTYPPAFAFDDPGVTWTPIAAQEPNDAFDRIDFVYYSNGDGITLLDACELDDRNSAVPWPSDHRAVLATFKLIPPEPSPKATLPWPADGLTDVACNPALTWLPGTGALTHDVYFGPTQPIALLTNQTTATFIPGTLEPGATYSWRIDEHTTSGIVTGDVWSFTTQPIHYYEWRFIDGNLAPSVGQGVLAYADAATAALTRFGVADDETGPLMNGQPTRYLYAPAFASAGNGYRVSFEQSGPNGGGIYLNQFTLIWDLLVPGPLGWTPLFNTNPQNANDADLYIDPSGRVGIGALGYSAAGTVRPDPWHRLAFVADFALAAARWYVDGRPVSTRSAALDGRHSLYSNVDPGPDLLLFNEGDTSGVHTHPVCLSAFFMADRPLSADEIESLGGPSPEGITVRLRPIELAIDRNAARLRLAWIGGGGFYQIQTSPNALPGTWVDMDAPTPDMGVVIEAGATASFYRIAAR